MISVSQVTIIIMKLVSVNFVWKNSDKLIKMPVPYVETEVMLTILLMVVIVVLMIISQWVQSVTVVHSIIDMMKLKLPDVPLVTLLVPNVTVLLKLIVLLVTLVPYGLITIQPLVCVKIMVVMIPINVLQVGTMMKTELIYVSEMNGLLEPMPEKPVEISLVNLLLSLLVVALTTWP